MEAASEAFKNKTKRIATSKLNDILLPIIKASPPTYLQRKNYKYQIHYSTARCFSGFCILL